MKTYILTIISIFFLGLGLQAQTPEKLNYQGIARNDNGEPMTNQLLGIRIKILNGNTPVYMETHHPTTNAYGLYTLAIGDGTTLAGQLSDVDWSTGNKFINIAIDPNGSTNYNDVGTTELLSVPYALYAKTSGNSGGGGGGNGDDWGSQTAQTNARLSGDGTTGNPLDIAQQGATNDQVLKWDGTTWAPADDETGSGGGTADDWGSQVVESDATLNGDGTNANLLGLADNAVSTSKVNDGAITSPKIDQMSATSGQVLKWDGTAWNPADDETGSGGGGTADDWGNQVAQTSDRISGDGTTANPLDIAAQGATNGQVLKYNGTNWVPGTDNGGSSGTTYTAGDGINISAGNEISSVLGTDIETGELQDDAVNTAKLGDAAVTGAKINQEGATNGQVLKWDGTTWAPADDATGGGGTADDWGSQVAQTDATLNGDGTTGNELGLADNAVTTAKLNDDAVTSPKIADMAATANQVLTYDGTGWHPADAQQGTTYTAGNGISIDGSNAISADLGTDIETGELQDAAVNTAKLGDASVTGAKINQEGATNGQVLKWDGTTWAPADDATGGGGTADDWGSQVAQTDATLNGDGTTGNELGLADNAVNTAKLNDDAVTSPKIADMAATANQVMTYDGTGWHPADAQQGTTYTAGNGISIDGSDAISADLGTDIETGELQDGAVTSPKINAMGATNGQVLTYDGSSWGPADNAGGNANGWALDGNAVGSSDFLGTTNTEALRFKQNDDPVGLIRNTNVSFGKNALPESSTGDKNSVLGNEALSSNTTGSINTAIGSQALKSNTSGLANTAVGQQTLYSNTTGQFNTAVGATALFANTTGYGNTGIGTDALGSNTSGDRNTAVGILALYANTEGNYNTATGRKALTANTTGENNTAVGALALKSNTTGEDNIAVGVSALESNTTADGNVATGKYALQNNTTGEDNTAVGHVAMRFNTTGGKNTANGFSALNSNNTGKWNTAIGYEALTANTTGKGNVATGIGALKANTTGEFNTASGYYALASSTSANNNTAYGNSALRSTTTGQYNTATGYNALRTNQTGNNNTAYGYKADVGDNDLTNATAIGYRAMAGQDNSLVLGSIAGVNGATNDTKVGIGTKTPSHRLNVVGNSQFENGRVGVNVDPTANTSFSYGQLIVKGQGGNVNLTLMEHGSSTDRYGFYVAPISLDLYYNGNQLGGWNSFSGAYSSTSDRRLKQDIKPVNSLLNKVEKVQVKSFSYKRDKEHRPQIGYIAQELEKQFPEFVNKPGQGKRDKYYTVNYAGMSAVAIKAIQEQQETIEKQGKELKKMHKKLKSFEARLSALEEEK